MCDRFPDHILIDLSIIVNDSMTNPHDLLPRHTRISGLHNWADVTRGFANRLDKVNKRDPKYFIAIIVLTSFVF